MVSDAEIRQFNHIFKQYDDVYRKAAKSYHMPELAMWILYILRRGDACTQKDLVEQLSQSKQSIHSALKTLVQDGYAVLSQVENNHRNKYVCLTETGITLAESTVDQLIAAEKDAFGSLSNAERKLFMELFERYSVSLQAKMNQGKQTKELSDHEPVNR